MPVPATAPVTAATRITNDPHRAAPATGPLCVYTRSALSLTSGPPPSAEAAAWRLYPAILAHGLRTGRRTSASVRTPACCALARHIACPHFMQASIDYLKLLILTPIRSIESAELLPDRQAAHRRPRGHPRGRP